MTSKSELQRQLVEAREFERSLRDEYQSIITGWREAHEREDAALAERAAFKRENEELAHSIEHLGAHLHTLQHLLEDILTLEPQLKHYLTDGDWDVERINRAAEHLRGEDALASLGYTDQCVKFPDNVTPLFPPTPGRGAA